MTIKALDAHCHGDLLIRYGADFPSRYRKLQCGGIIWSYMEEVASWEDYSCYWESLRDLCHELSSGDEPFFYLVGVHPRSIASDLEGFSGLPEPVSVALSIHLDDPLCLGLGELGLDAGNSLEERILRWQLDWALERLPTGKRIGIHTPRHNKERITVEILSLLEKYAPLREKILIDHVTPKTWPILQDKNYMVGMTLQDGKVSLEELLDFIGEHPHLRDRIMLNSDGARALSSYYLRLLEQPALLDGACRDPLLRGNAIRFFGLNFQTGSSGGESQEM